MKENKIVKLSWEETEYLVEKLAKKLEDKDFDIILAVNRGGLVIGSLLSDRLSLPLGVIAANAYKYGSKERKKDVNISPSVASTDEVKGNVIIVDELVDSGKTMLELMNHFSKLEGISSLATACLIRKPHSKYIPDYYVREEEGWVIFPFQKKEFENL